MSHRLPMYVCESCPCGSHSVIFGEEPWKPLQGTAGSQRLELLVPNLVAQVTFSRLTPLGFRYIVLRWYFSVQHQIALARSLSSRKTIAFCKFTELMQRQHQLWLFCGRRPVPFGGSPLWDLLVCHVTIAAQYPDGIDPRLAVYARSWDRHYTTTRRDRLSGNISHDDNVWHTKENWVGSIHNPLSCRRAKQKGKEQKPKTNKTHTNTQKTHEKTSTAGVSWSVHRHLKRIKRW